VAAKFIVDFGDIEMSREVRNGIEKEIQSAVLSAVAEMDFEGDLVARFPIGKWGGIILRREFVSRLDQRTEAIERAGLSNSFVVDLGDIPVSRATQHEIEKQIQSAALGALARLDLQGDVVAHFPRGWAGGLIARSEHIGKLAELSKGIEKYAAQE